MKKKMTMGLTSVFSFNSLLSLSGSEARMDLKWIYTFNVDIPQYKLVVLVTSIQSLVTSNSQQSLVFSFS